MSKLTRDQAESFAPDSGTLSRGRKIAKPAAYTNIGADDRAIWGTALGSSEYLSLVDLNGPAFRCSCPVKKLPCKHIMGLMLLVADDPSLATSDERPEPLTEWLTKRDGAAKAKESRASGEIKDPEAQARRAAKREANVDQGVQELRLFLEDILTAGLAESGKRTHDVWDNMRRRLVDAQAGGLANRVESLRGLVSQGAESTEQALVEITQLNLLCQAWHNRQTLDEGELSYLRQQIGWSRTTSSPPDECRDWLVLSNERRYEDGLNSQRIWLLDPQHQRFAYLLHFASAAGGASLPGGFAPGRSLNGHLRFDSTWSPLRAELEATNLLTEPTPISPDVLTQAAHDNLLDAIQCVQMQRAQNPFSEQWPLMVSGMRLASLSGALVLADNRGHAMALDPDFKATLRLMHLAGPAPCTLFMSTRDGQTLLPLGGHFADTWHSLASDNTGD
ncbi:SWIM zinc finger family protein [Marinobacterium weihaiense]|uniref:SWIM zinc finger family protein n=1 Tax=Marinobacterium weihaiense TaxID=2851016 RepID=A0ABS6M645_9GAMM|nr:SWIM zinc finger family protein [Marinobacterium weihaiense]MBV0931743.1 SWIM zinc finger family protein [Marinobacterium weihaiense]